MSGSEIIVILLLALVVLGPEKLPEALRRAGRTYSELKKMGNSFQSDPASAANDPMACQYGASDFRPYASRARWFRTANDSYFTAMTFPEGLPAVMQPSDLHDATWAAASRRDERSRAAFPVDLRRGSAQIARCA